ncbi:alpha-L-fucosidase [Foetidibacter luteolus]|uniref:alpha-L-fucosidase n=1 Tax=Foetidibacter luteolus TaxID=2608880 RepID=UPI00129A6043|nr:alpha-L-fucosidase [Foetidibacter luteolus]
MKRLHLLLTGLCFVCVSFCQNVKPVGPTPSARQLQWSGLEYYFFAHFGPNTFTDLEWGHGTEHEEVFNPTSLDCRQWCRIAKAAGAKGIIITAKHHDGFCLWPSKYSTHTVAQSTWRNGKGDVLKELSDACKEYGLKMGIYLSPWDRNHPKYGTDEYNDVFVNMMKEVVARYGPLFEFWWDGANGEGPNGKKQVYDWHRFEKTLRTIAPNTPVFSDIGPDIRWVGNEKGIAGKTNWNLLDTAGFARGLGSPPNDTLNQGNVYGKVWLQSECDVSIRPGWFYHAKEDDQVKTPEELFDLYLKSVGRGSALLLNIPPDRRGLFNEHDSAALVGFKKLRDENFKTPLLAKKNVPVTNNKTTLKLPTTSAVNCIVLQEPVQYGQRVISFTILLKKNGETVREVEATTIGRKRILTFPSTVADAVDIVIKETKAKALISHVALYAIAENLVEK